MKSPPGRKDIWRRLVALAALWLAIPGNPGSPIAPLPCAADETKKEDHDSGAPGTPDAAEAAALKKKHAEYLKQMQQRAAAADVRVAGAESAAELIAEPLMRFNNRSLRNVDATLWGWTSGGRLVGVCKLIRFEKFRPDEGPWLYCFTSLSPERVDAEFAGGHRFSPEKPGIELRKLDKPPIPGRGKVERLRQMKEISNRFAATTTDYADRSEELRLLPRPIYRYELTDRNKLSEGDLLDGALFAMTIEGTAPAALVLVELHHREDEASDWQFAVAASTWASLSVKLDGKEVWTKQTVVKPGNYDTWASFWEE